MPVNKCLSLGMEKTQTINTGSNDCQEKTISMGRLQILCVSDFHYSIHYSNGYGIPGIQIPSIEISSVSYNQIV